MSVVIVFILFFVFLFFSPLTYAKGPLSENGTLDLSTWNFQQDGIISLDGEWTFYPNQLLTPMQIANTPSLEKVSLQVPGRWINASTTNPMSDRGIGTYRLQVKVNANSLHRYALKLVNIRSSSRIFVNGSEVGELGNPARTKAEGYKSQVMPLIAFFPVETDTVDIIIQVANWDYYNGGIIQTISFGSEQDILATNMRATIVDTISIACLLLSSIYYISIFIMRKQDKRFLYFAISCMAYVFIMATSNEKVLHHFLPNIPFLYVVKLKIIATCLSIIYVILFIRELEKAFIPLVFSRIIISVMLGNMLLVICIPPTYLFVVEKGIAPSYIVSYVCMALLVLKSIKQRTYKMLNRKAAFLLLLSIVLVVLAILNDFLYFYSIISTPIMSTFVLFYLVMGTTIFLIGEYVKTYSDLEEMSCELMETDKLKDEFLLRTSHEFQTPLHGIVNIARIAMQQQTNTAKQQENLSYIIAIASRLSNLVHDIIDFQNIRRNRLRMQPQLFDVNGTVQAVIDVYQHMKKSDDVQLINHIPSGMYYMYTDENRCKQILMNLLSNALKHTEEGSIEVRATVQEHLIAISIIDTGSGISEDIQAQLFDDDYLSMNMDDFSNDKTPSVGLAISKQLALHMEGDLYLENSTLEMGSHFILALPKANEEQIHTYSREKTNEQNVLSPTMVKVKQIDSVSNTQKKIKVLLVDDEPSTIKILQGIFTSPEYETLIAYDGQQALDIVHQTKDIAIVLLDVMMPTMSGYEVCQQIRNRYPLYELPILLLTIRNTAEDITKGIEMGANDFLAKPLDARELQARVATLLKMKEAMQEAIQMETYFLQSQIQPHFLYNSLSIIVSLCYSDPERAGQLLGELSHYLRQSFDMNPKQSLISLKKELSHVKSYVTLEKARFGDRLDVQMDISQDVLSYPVPALIIQPLVENAIRHGLLKKRVGGTVSIEAQEVDRTLQIIIRDNGVGMSDEKVSAFFDNTTQSGHVGLKNVHKRLMNEYGQGLQITSKEGEGTTIHIQIPLTEKIGDVSNDSCNDCG